MTRDRHRMSRDRILAGARAILDSGHYGDLTVDALARSLQMSKSTLYKYFSSKEDVVVALVREACDTAEVELGRAVASGPSAAQLSEVAAVIGRHGERMPRAVLVDLDRLPPSCVERIRQTRASFAQAGARALERGVSRKELRHPDPALVAVAFAAACEAVLTDGARSGETEHVVRLAHVPGLFLPALSPK
jgi:AcrR family transcriptional regulator